MVCVQVQLGVEPEIGVAESLFLKKNYYFQENRCGPAALTPNKFKGKVELLFHLSSPLALEPT